MDLDGIDTDAMREALTRIGSFTRVFGGVRAVRRLLRSYPDASLLDVGAGDVSLLNQLRSESNGRPWVGVDSHRDVARVAARSAKTHLGVCVIRADGKALPFRDRSFDVVISMLTLHHLDDHGAVQLLSEMARVARRAVYVWDLERSAVALGGALALAHTVWRRDPLVRHDAPLSVRRAFTVAELGDRARDAGLGRVRVRRVWPARLELSATAS